MFHCHERMESMYYIGGTSLSGPRVCNRVEAQYFAIALPQMPETY